MVKEQTIVTGMAGRYATALYELAKENNAVEDVVAALETIPRHGARERRSPPADPQSRHSRRSQVKALDAILAKAGISGIAANFLRVIATKRRLFAVETMIRDF